MTYLEIQKTDLKKNDTTFIFHGFTDTFAT